MQNGGAPSQDLRHPGRHLTSLAPHRLCCDQRQIHGLALWERDTVFHSPPAYSLVRAPVVGVQVPRKPLSSEPLLCVFCCSSPHLNRPLHPKGTFRCRDTTGDERSLRRRPHMQTPNGSMGTKLWVAHNDLPSEVHAKLTKRDVRPATELLLRVLAECSFR